MPGLLRSSRQALWSACHHATRPWLAALACWRHSSVSRESRREADEGGTLLTRARLDGQEVEAQNGALRDEVHALADDLGALLAEGQGLSNQLSRLAAQRGAWQQQVRSKP